MGAFELERESADCRRCVEEQCIIAHKVYDQCRSLNWNNIHHLNSAKNNYPKLYPFLYKEIVVWGKNVSYDFSFGLNINAAKNANNTAALIPPAAAFIPPVKTPKNPIASTSSITPFAKL